MNFIKGSIIGATIGGMLAFRNYDKLENMVKVSKRKIKNMKKKNNYSIM